MMPTFPRSPLSFRTAGFPQYGWKAGFPSGAFLDRQQLKPCSRHAPSVDQFASALRAPRSRSDCPALCRAVSIEGGLEKEIGPGGYHLYKSSRMELKKGMDPS